MEFNNAWHVRGIGRTHKVTRSDIMGCVAALDRWLALDHPARLVEARGKCERLCAELEGVAGLTARIDDTNVETFDAYGVDVSLELGDLDALEMIARLKAGALCTILNAPCAQLTLYCCCVVMFHSMNWLVQAHLRYGAGLPAGGGQRGGWTCMCLPGRCSRARMCRWGER